MCFTATSQVPSRQFNPELHMIFYVSVGFLWVSLLWFLLTFQIHKDIYLGVNERMNMYVHGFLWWTGFPIIVTSLHPVFLFQAGTAN